MVCCWVCLSSQSRFLPWQINDYTCEQQEGVPTPLWRCCQPHNLYTIEETALLSFFHLSHIVCENIQNKGCQFHWLNVTIHWMVVNCAHCFTFICQTFWCRARVSIRFPSFYSTLQKDLIYLSVCKHSANYRPFAWETWTELTCFEFKKTQTLIIRTIEVQRNLSEKLKNLNCWAIITKWIALKSMNVVNSKRKITRSVYACGGGNFQVQTFFSQLRDRISTFCSEIFVGNDSIFHSY